MLMLSAAILLAGSAATGSSSGQEALVIGDWTCEKSCPDEEIAFTVEDGKHRYASWVNRHPSVVDAEWSLRGSDLTVTRDGEVLYEWKLVKVTKTRLVMRDKESSPDSAADDITMKRVSVM
jgi:hypothetical protein